MPFLPTIVLLLLHGYIGSVAYRRTLQLLRDGVTASTDSGLDNDTSDVSANPVSRLPTKAKQTSTDCSDKVIFRRSPSSVENVRCTVMKNLCGGCQANTNIVDIDGDIFVMKETCNSDTVWNLMNERARVQDLQKAQFRDMPLYYLGFQTTQPFNRQTQSGCEVIVMELLDGWFDLNKGAPQETTAVRQVRAAAFFLALNNMFKAKISHCDLNPGNVMFSYDDPTRCKIIDFGMAARNYALPGSCLATNGNPDLGRPGTAWNHIFGRLCVLSFGPATGKDCDTQAQWQNIVGHAQVIMLQVEPPQIDYSRRQPLDVCEPEMTSLPKEESTQMRNMTWINSKDLAQRIQSGTTIMLNNLICKVEGPPKVGASYIDLNLVVESSQSRLRERVFWASNKNELLAEI